MRDNALRRCFAVLKKEINGCGVESKNNKKDSAVKPYMASATATTTTSTAGAAGPPPMFFSPAVKNATTPPPTSGASLRDLKDAFALAESAKATALAGDLSSAIEMCTQCAEFTALLRNNEKDPQKLKLIDGLYATVTGEVASLKAQLEKPLSPQTPLQEKKSSASQFPTPAPASSVAPLLSPTPVKLPPPAPHSPVKFLALLAFFQFIVWMLILIAGYLYFYG
jgi:hypothetical protein